MRIAEEYLPIEKNGRRRRAVLVVCWLVVALIGLGGLRIAAFMVDESRAMGHYEQKDYAAARSGFMRTTLLNPFSSWIGHFNAGAAAYQLGDFTGATTEFSKALSLAPKDRACMVGLNLAWTWEALGDMQREGGHVDEARESLGRAKQIVVQLKCSQQPSSGSSSAAQSSGSSADASSLASQQPSASAQPSGLQSAASSAADDTKQDGSTTQQQQQQTGQRVQSKLDQLQHSKATHTPDEPAQQGQLQQREQQAQAANQQQGAEQVNPGSQASHKSW